MNAAKPTTEIRISPRVVLRPGDWFRLIGGPTFVGDDGERHRLPLRGTFELRAIIRSGPRTWLECQEVQTLRESILYGATRTVFVDGPPYCRAGLAHRPFRVRRARRPAS